jgi:hypothetical protein
MKRKTWVLSGAALVMLWGLAGGDQVFAFSTRGTRANGGGSCPGGYCPGTDPNYMPPSLQYIRNRSVGIRVAQYQPPVQADPEQHYSAPPSYQRRVQFQGPPGPAYGPPRPAYGPPPRPAHNFGFRRFGPRPRFGRRPPPRWGDPRLARLRYRLNQSLHALRTELRGPNPDRARAMSLVREINSLRSRILKRRVLNRLRHLGGVPRVRAGYAPPPRYLPGGNSAYEPAPRRFRPAPKAAPPPAPAREKPGVKFPEPQRWW